MIFSHDVEVQLQAAVDLVATADEPDTLTEIAQLDAFYRDYLYSGAHAGTPEELAEVRAIRPRLREILLADRDAAALLANDWLAEAGAVPQLHRHDGEDWHIHAVAADAPLAIRILVETAMSMTDVIRLDEMSRLAACADPECPGIVLDLSRNRSKRFCSATCSNRIAQSRLRSRRAAEA